MSKIRANRWETLDGIGAGVIYVDTIAELQALDTSGLVDGQAASVHGSEFRWSGSEWEPIGPVNVKAFGAVGDGVTDDLPALKEAVDFAPEGGMTLLFPNGHYYTPRADVTDIDSWLLVEKNNIKLLAENRHGAILENFIILARGHYGDKFKLGSPLASGSKTVTTEGSNSLFLNDYVQLLSGINPYSKDAGEWQGGSVNPTKNERTNCLFSEIHRVAVVNSSNSFDIYDEVVYPVYHPNTEGQEVTVSGVDGAYARKISLVENFSCEGLVFKRQEGSSFRGVYFQRSHGGGMFDCLFLTNDGDDGRHIRTEESVKWTMRDCLEFRNPIDNSGSSWNSVIIGGGSQDIKIINNTFRGGAQIIDITPARDSNLLFGEASNHGPDDLYLTCHSFVVSGNYFTGAGDAFTTHPATYRLSFANNLIETGSTGARIRSRGNLVSGNSIRTRRSGVSLSAFYDDTTIVGNNIRQLPDPDGLSWTAISVSPMSSEVMNNNDVKNVIFTGNVISADFSEETGTRHGIQIRHFGDGVPANEEFDEFTPEVKTSLSDYTFSGNVFEGCGISIMRYVNGVKITNNYFKGAIDRDNWIRGASSDSVRHTILNNCFYDDSNSDAISLSDSTTESYGYGTNHSVGSQFGVYSSVTLDIPDSSFITARGSKNILHDGLSLRRDGYLRAVRESGDVTLSIYGEPLDGEGRARVNINNDSGTEDNRLYNYGRFIQNDGDIWSSPDNENRLGSSAYRWSEVYAGNGVINTSDAREKQQVAPISEVEGAVAEELKGLIRKFKWNHAVEKKGDAARWHFGVMAQEVVEVFIRHGLDARDYGLFCYDEWGAEYDEDGAETLAAGNRYGVRYDQLLAFIISAM